MIEHFIITVLVIYGIHASTREGMILNGFNRWLWLILSNVDDIHTSQKRISAIDKLFKTLFDCTPCMASLYGTISFLMTDVCFEYGILWQWAVWVFSLCGFNWLLNKIINR